MTAGALGMVLALLTGLAGCDNGNGDDDDNGGGNGVDSALVAKWYTSQSLANAETTTAYYEVKADGKVLINGSDDQQVTITASGGKIAVNVAGVSTGTANYIINGTELTISNVGSTGLVAGVYYKKAGGDSGGDGIAVTFLEVTAEGSAAETTTQLTLVFSAEITGLSAGDIILSGVSGVSKGILGTGYDEPYSYTLPISGFTSGGTLTVAVSKSGYAISPASKTVTIYTGWNAVANPKFATTTINAIAYGGGKFVAVGNEGKAAYSTDGVTWTAVNDTGITSSFSIYGIAYGAGKFVAVGGNGKMAYCTDPSGTWTGIDPEDGEPFGPLTPTTIRAIAYGNDKFVAVGEGRKAAYSTDGINWTAVEDEDLPYIFYTSGAITYGGGKFVAVGSNEAAYSPDGINWTAVADPKFGGSSIFGITYGGGKFVAVGDGKVAYSTDGVTWIASSGDTEATEAIAYGSGKFVAVGGFGKAAYSADGETWTGVDLGAYGKPFYAFSAYSISAIAYGDGKFVAVGQNGKAAYWVTP
jgi:hypothetical protein